MTPGIRVEVHVRGAGSKLPAEDQDVLPLRVLQATRLGQLCDLVALQLATKGMPGGQPSGARLSSASGYPDTTKPGRPLSAKPREDLSLRLIFEGRSLKETDEDRPLGELGISDGAVVHCVTSPKAKKDQRVSCHPLHCSVEGGRVVHVVGEVFPFSTRIACRFGTVSVPADVEDDGAVSGIATLRCMAPAHPAGPVAITLSFDGGATWLDDGPSFWYVDPLAAGCPLGVAVPSSCRGLTGTQVGNFATWGMRWDDNDRDQGGGSGCV